MTVWDEYEEFKDSELAVLVKAAPRLTLDQIERFTKDAWRELEPLDFVEREILIEGLLNGSYDPGVDAYETEEAAEVRSKFERFRDKYGPKNSAELVAWMTLLVTLLQYLDDEGPREPPAPIVIIREIPEQIRPLPPLPSSGDGEMTV